MRNSSASRSTPFLRGLLRLPARFLAWIRDLAAGLYNFWNEEPEDVGYPEAISRTINDPVSLLDHIEALRWHVIRSAAFLFVASILSLRFSPQIFWFIQRPIQALTDQGLRISGPGEILDLIPRVALTAALLFSLPYIFFEAWLYAAPGLGKRSRLLSLVIGIFLIILFAAGFIISYYLVLPLSLKSLLFMTEYFGTYDWELVKYTSFATKILFSSVLLLLIPFLTSVILYSYKGYRLDVRYALLGSFVLAAALTPGTMVLLDIGLATIVFTTLYASYALARLVLPKKRTPAATGAS